MYRIHGGKQARVELHENIKIVLQSENASDPIKLLLCSWIYYPNSLFENEVMQHDTPIKDANTALWLKYMEVSFLLLSGRYNLTEEESVLLGCLKCQV